MEKAIVQACDSVHLVKVTPKQMMLNFPWLTTSSTKKISFSMKINGESTAYFQMSVHVSQDLVNSGDLRIET